MGFCRGCGGLYMGWWEIYRGWGAVEAFGEAEGGLWGL